jgi:hypothetical protein
VTYEKLGGKMYYKCIFLDRPGRKETAINVPAKKRNSKPRVGGTGLLMPEAGWLPQSGCLKPIFSHQSAYCSESSLLSACIYRMPLSANTRVIPDLVGSRYSPIVT